MKKKFANAKSLKSVDGGMYENIAYYARVVAGKYGGRKEEAMREHLMQMFKALDEIGVLRHVNQRDFSKKIFEMYFDFDMSFEDSPGVLACYGPIQNYIATRGHINFGEATFIHEFLHLMSTSKVSFSKKGETAFVNEDLARGGSLFVKSGFGEMEWGFGRQEVVRSGGVLSEKEVVATLLSTMGEVTPEAFQGLVSVLGPYGIQNPSTIAIDGIKLPQTLSEKELLAYMEAVATGLSQLLQAIKAEGVERTIVVNPMTALAIRPHKGGDTYEVNVLQVLQEKGATHDDFRMFNEGCTEFMAKLVDARIKKKSVLTDAYMTETKYIACLYSVLGNEVYNGYFGNSMKPLADAAGFTEKEFDKFARLIESVHPLISKISQDLEAGKDIKEDCKVLTKIHHDIYDDMTKMLINKMVKDLYKNPSKYNNAREIRDSVIVSFVDFTKNVHFGFSNKAVLRTDEYGVMELISDRCGEAINKLIDCAVAEDSYMKLPPETITALTKMKPMLKSERISLIDFLRYANNVEYFFIQPEIKEIVPTNYIGKEDKIFLRDLDAQDKIRSETVAFYKSRKKGDPVTYPNAKDRRKMNVIKHLMQKDDNTIVKEKSIAEKDVLYANKERDMADKKVLYVNREK